MNQKTKRGAKSTAAKSVLHGRAQAVVALGIAVGIGFYAYRVLSNDSALHLTGATDDSRTDVATIEPPKVPDDIDAEVHAAVQADRAAVRRNPRSGDAWGRLGMLLLSHEFNTRAATCFEQAAVHSPNEPKWPYLHARSIMAMQPNEAIPLLEQAVELCGNRPAAPRLTLIELYLELYRLDEAEAHLLEYQVSNAANPRARLASARLAMMREQFAKSAEQLEVLKKYMSRIPRYRGRAEPVYHLLAEVRRRMGDVEAAEQARRRALIEKKPIWPDDYWSEMRQRQTGLKRYLVDADRMYGRKQYEKSIALLRKTIDKYPDSTWAHILLGRALIRTGAPDSSHPDRERRLQEAEEVLREALSLEPNSVETLFRLGVVKGYQQDYRASAELYLRAIEIKPDFTMAYYNLAQCRRHMLDMQGAIKALRGVVSCEPDHLKGHLQLGDLLLRSQRVDEALKHLEIANQMAPGHRAVTRLLGQARRLAAAGSSQ